jgi:hypothetical protein
MRQEIMVKRIILVALLLGAGLLVACTAGVTATEPASQPGSPADSAPGATIQDVKVEFTGVVDALDGAILTVDGRTFVLTESTELQSAVSVGDAVRVQAAQQSDGALVAREVEVIPAASLNANLNGNDNANSNSNDDNANGNENEDNVNDNANGNDNSNANSNANSNDDNDDGDNSNANSNQNDDGDNSNGNTNSNDDDDDDDNDSEDDGEDDD